MKNLFFVILFFISTKNSLAACGGSVKTALIFANGMFNERSDANISLKELRAEYKKKYPEYDFYTNDVAYNTNEFWLKQLLQVHRQKGYEAESVFWRNLGNLLSLEESRPYRDFIASLKTPSDISDQDLTDQIKKYTALLAKKINIVTVAHSQGNLYTLFAFEKVNSPLTQMVSVATPASQTFHNGPYFTFVSDGVIKYIPTALTPNLVRNPAGFFDHEFVAHYLHDADANKTILEAVHNAVGNNHPDDQLQEWQEHRFNSDMFKVLSWAEKSYERKDLNNSECLIMRSLLYMYGRQGSTCEEKNFASLQNSLNDCILDRQDPSRQATLCPYWAGMDGADFFSIYWPVYISTKHYENSPRCKVSIEQFEKKFTLNDIEKAKALAKTLNN